MCLGGDPSLLRLQCFRRRDKNYHISPALSPSPQGRRVPLPNAEFGDKELGRHNSSPSSFPLPLGFACLLWELFILSSIPPAEQGKTQLPHSPTLLTPPHYTGVRAEVWIVNFILRLDIRKAVVAIHLYHIHHKSDILSLICHALLPISTVETGKGKPPQFIHHLIHPT